MLAWTVRDDDAGGPLHADADADVRRRPDIGVDGIFSDHPHTTLLARDAWAAERLSRAVEARAATRAATRVAE